MDWIEKAYREFYKLGDKQALLPSDRAYVDALRAAEPKGVRMFMARLRGGTLAPVHTAYKREMLKCPTCYTIVPVEVREVEAEEPAPKPEEPKMFETYRLGETKFERCGNETRSLREGRFYVCAGGSLPFMAMADRVAPEDYYPLRIVGGDEEYDPNVLALARALHDLVEHAKGNRP